MTENNILFFLIVLCITVIPIGLCLYLTISREADEVSRRCDEIGAWAKKELMIQWCEDCKHNYNHHDDWPNDYCDKCIDESKPGEIPTKYEAEGKR